ncbi:MAG: tetratricopeptide repeat protein [Candidatus Omnitrophota bacterium]
MKPVKPTLSFIAALLFLLSVFPASGQDRPSGSGDVAVLRQLEANRSLLARYRAEYAKLRSQEEEEISPSLNRKLDNLKYKISALDEDRSKLHMLLPQARQAHEIMKDLLTQKAGVRLFEEEAAPLRKKVMARAETMPRTDKDAVASSLNAMHEEALEYVTAKRYDKAARIYEEIILLNPNDDQAYIIMGHIYLLSGLYDKAEEAFMNAVHIDPENTTEIAPFYENLTIQNPGDDTAYSNLGYAYMILGEFIKARQAFKDALQINPGNERAMQGVQFLDGQSGS